MDAVPASAEPARYWWRTYRYQFVYDIGRHYGWSENNDRHGIAKINELHPVQQAFIDKAAGPVWLLNAGYGDKSVSLLMKNPNPPSRKFEEVWRAYLSLYRLSENRRGS